MTGYFPIPTTGVSRERFIRAMRQVAASVTVVTTDGAAGRHGATVSAFTSLSADPPSVLVCLRADSRIAQAVNRNGRFAINVLPEGSAEVASRFAGANDGDLADRFTGVKLKEPGWDCPALKGGSAFLCQLFNIVPHASHLIVIGHVAALSCGGDPPLTYLDGRYHRLQPN